MNDILIIEVQKYFAVFILSTTLKSSLLKINKFKKIGTYYIYLTYSLTI
jgi:hypothetical protein